jgi:hypothetical protein
MSPAETALKERAGSAESRAGAGKLPFPREYTVDSTGAPAQVPLGAHIAITVVDFKGWFTLDGETLGQTLPLPNGDFKVSYGDPEAPMVLQFRQAGLAGEYMFGASFAGLPSVAAKAMDDPPITGVWGAEARPPHEYPAHP